MEDSCREIEREDIETTWQTEKKRRRRKVSFEKFLLFYKEIMDARHFYIIILFLIVYIILCIYIYIYFTAGEATNEILT